MKKVLIALLVIIVLLLGGAYAYLALSTGEYDDIAALSSAPPMASADRFLVNPKDKTVSILIDRQDLLRMAKNELGMNVMEKVEETVSEYGLTVEAMGIRMNGPEAQVDLKMKYRNFLPLPVSGKVLLSEENGVISAEPDTVSIGKLINLEVTSLSNRFGEFSIPEIDLKELSPLLKDVKSVDFGKNKMTITIPYPLEWLMHGIDTATSAFSMILDFVDLEELNTPVHAMFDAIEGNDSELVELLEDDPSGLADLKTELLGLNGSYTRSKFFDEDAKGAYAWLLPEITEEVATAAGKQIIAQYQALYDQRVNILSDTWQYILDAYANGEMAVKNGKLVYPANGNAEVVLSELETLDGAESWLDLDAARIVLATNPGDFALNQVPKGNTVTSIILKTHTDRPVIAYRYLSTMFKIRSITQDEYDKLMSASKIPTFDIGEATTKR